MKHKVSALHDPATDGLFSNISRYAEMTGSHPHTHTYTHPLSLSLLYAQVIDFL